MYINKEQRWDVKTFVAREHMVDATQHMGLGGVGRENVRCR